MRGLGLYLPPWTDAILWRSLKKFLHLRNTFAMILFLGLFAMAARNVVDPDVWWHLKTGEWMVQHHAVPHTDPFSYTRAGQPWTAHEWLSELLIYSLYRGGGYAALTVAFAAITTAAFFPLYLRSKSTRLAAGMLTVWGALATATVWGVRPQILSLLLTSIWLLILERSETKPALLWWTLPLTLLWVNLHAGFILGCVVFALFIAGEFIETLVSSPAQPRKSRLRWLTLALLGNLALVPLNPNGASLFWYPVETLRSTAMQNHITEWASPNFHALDYVPLFLLILATFATLAISGRRIRFRDILLLLVGTAAALSSARMIPLFVLIAVPLVSHSIPNWPVRESSLSPPSTRSALLNAGIVLAMVAFSAAHTTRMIHGQAQAEAATYPAAAVAYLRQHSPAGPIFNHDDWGGYLIFNLYPETRVFIDGRADVYGDGLLQFVHTYYLEGPWRQPLCQWKVTSVIVPPWSPVASALRELPSWSVSFEDPVAVVFSKSDTAESRPFCPLTSVEARPASRYSRPIAPPYQSARNYTLPRRLRGMMWESNCSVSPCSSRAY